MFHRFILKGRESMKRICAGLLALLLCLTALSVTALAADTTLDIRYVPITEDGFVADTMDGVDAIYNLWGGPDCADLVIRYYDAVFGVDVQLGGVPVVTGGEGWLEETDVPQRGDILYASAAARGNSTHYALCKSVDEAAGTVTLFEQNWVWDGQAGVDRVIPLDSCYTYYTLCGANADAPRSDDSEPVREEPSDSWTGGSDFDLSVLGTPSGWAESYVERAADYGVLSGLTSGYQSAITRGEFAQLAVNAAEILTGEYYYGSVSDRAESLGLMFGDGKGNFRLNDSLTRQEAAVICTRCAGDGYARPFGLRRRGGDRGLGEGRRRHHDADGPDGRYRKGLLTQGHDHDRAGHHPVRPCVRKNDLLRTIPQDEPPCGNFLRAEFSAHCQI